MFFFLLFPACLFSFNYIWVTVLQLLYCVQVRLKQVPDRPVESGFVFRIYRRLLWFMCAPDQICGLLWKVSAAPHALPVLARVHLSVQLQPAEWCRFWGREQCACVPPAAGASWIAQHGGATDALARHSVFSLSLCSTLIQRLSWHTYTKTHTYTQTLILWLYVTHRMWDSVALKTCFWKESVPSLTTHHSTQAKETLCFPRSHTNPVCQ